METYGRTCAFTVSRRASETKEALSDRYNRYRDDSNDKSFNQKYRSVPKKEANVGTDVRYREDLRIFEHENFDGNLRKMELAEFERRILKLCELKREEISIKQLAESFKDREEFKDIGDPKSVLYALLLKSA